MCVFIRNSLNCLQVDIDVKYKTLEIVIFDLFCESFNLRFFCVYRPPHNDHDRQEYLNLLIECIVSYSAGLHTNLILGDINCYIDWKNKCSHGDYVNQTFLKFVVESVNFHTRGANVLDVILSDDPLIVNSVSAAPPLGHSDHLMVTV